jgi:hypothetical protein
MRLVMIPMNLTSVLMRLSPRQGNSDGKNWKERLKKERNRRRKMNR